ncbi:Tellurite resistance protein TerB [Enhygromyxa salina]|uniref:Tellurite resistance protein TerB n=1 Tax=Enhygromyxa salina TaxID=215803 RepID=A0A2S9XXS2_9BACT|nr:TerB family tellurite resistance protein [Enhygromyxa salina]PRP97656.1 Tellurite resistance protein TerB [Enhygromyxa salina]
MLTPEQEWTLVACGMIAHADDMLEFGEWDQILRLIDTNVDDEQMQPWLDMLGDRPTLERRFAELEPPLPHFAEELLEQAWRMALADGSGSEVEAAVHDRIAEKIGVSPDQAQSWRDRWTAEAATRAELVVGFAAALANLDGRMDSAEAAQFDSLLERMPVSVSRRVELSMLLYSPPKLEALGGRLVGLERDAREAVLYEVAPLVQASERGDREREVFFELAELAAVSPERARELLAQL